jgi:hypothetical protein
LKTPEDIVKDYTTYLGGLSVIYEDKVVEMMYEYAKESSAQVRENLSYYIDLADRYYQEGEKLRGEKQILETLKEDAETRACIWKEKYENLKREMENVADFFAKYERRVI